jgi:hypothetical protein
MNTKLKGTYFFKIFEVEKSDNNCLKKKKTTKFSQECTEKSQASKKQIPKKLITTLKKLTKEKNPS